MFNTIVKQVVKVKIFKNILNAIMINKNPHKMHKNIKCCSGEKNRLEMAIYRMNQMKLLMNDEIYCYRIFKLIVINSKKNLLI